MARFFRQENPPRLEDYRDYLSLLRTDFRNRCAYCERPESPLWGEEPFEIDHFRPRLRFPELAAEYSNLYYTCSKCNRHKGSTWPSKMLADTGFRFSDPCAEDMYSAHLTESDDGLLKATTNCGRYTADHIRLNRSVLLGWRQIRRKMRSEIGILQSTVERVDSLLVVETNAARKEEIRKELDTLRHRIAQDRALYLDD